MATADLQSRFVQGMGTCWVWEALECCGSGAVPHGPVGSAEVEMVPTPGPTHNNPLG